jgi:hypothetical protein
MTAMTPSETQAPQTAPQALPSGRSVVLRYGDGEEQIEVRSPSGEVEVRIVLTDRGPVVRLRGARLELEAPEEIALTCGRLAVHTKEALELASAGAVHVRAEEDLRLDGKMIYLNS